MKVITMLLVTMLTSSITIAVYAKNDKQKVLPPGLEKKVQSGKSLPPGWQKKLAVGELLDKRVYEYGHVVHRNPQRGIISIAAEDKVIRVIENTREIVEIIDSF